MASSESLAEDRILGIDLGSTNSVVAVAQEREARVLPTHRDEHLIPSVVSFHPSGTILVGGRARERRLVDAANTIHGVKRLIGRPFESPEVTYARERTAFPLIRGTDGAPWVRVRRGTYTLPEVSAFVLREVTAVAAARLGSIVKRAVVTVPASFNELQRSATQAAAMIAKLDVVQLVNEPTAAAVAYGYGREGAERVAVFDLGGGTFDVTVLGYAGGAFYVLGTYGNTFLGGDDIDLAIANEMAALFLEQHRWDARQDHQAFERLRAAAENVKCRLSTETTASTTVRELTYGPGGKRLDLEYELTRPALDRMLRPLVEAALEACGEALRLADTEVIDLDAVILVGGSTRIPLVRSMVADYFGMDPRTDADPDLVVALGAAILGHAHLAPDRPVPQEHQVEPGKVGFAPPGIGAATSAWLRKAKTRPLGPAVQVDAPEVVVAPADEPALPAVKEGFRKPPSPPLPPPLPVEVAERTPPGLPPSDRPPRPTEEPVPSPRARTSTKPGPAFNPFKSGIPPAPEVEDAPLEDAVFVSPNPPPTQTTVAIAPGDAPLLVDVTPHSLGLETVGGYMELVVERNSPIPLEKTRIFATGTDLQDSARVSVCQGESQRFVDNQVLGDIELTGLRQAKRGEVKIIVTFSLDLSGILSVRATDPETGNEQAIRVNLLGGLSPERLAVLRARQDRELGEG